MVDRDFVRHLLDRNRRTLWLAALAIPALVLAGALLWKVPEWQTPNEVTDPKDRSELQNQFRRTGAEIILGGLALVGVFLVWRRVAASERTAAFSRDHVTTDRFNQAIEQLASPSPAITLGGIYTLERIARSSPNEDHWQVMEVLTAYVRENAPWSASDHRNGAATANGTSPVHGIPANVQAALAVLGRRDRSHETLEQRLDLAYTDLRGADLEKAQLQRADLTGANLQGARLGSARLDGATLEGAILADARLVGTHLGEARLRGANLAGAKLWDAQLAEADLQAANLEGALLGGADLRRARLWDAQLKGADFQGAKLDGAMGLPEVKEPPKPKPSPVPRAVPPVPAELSALPATPGRRSQTVVYLNRVMHERRRNDTANGHRNPPVEETKPVAAPEPAPEPTHWGTGDEDS